MQVSFLMDSRGSAAGSHLSRSSLFGLSSLPSMPFWWWIDGGQVKQSWHTIPILFSSLSTISFPFLNKSFAPFFYFFFFVLLHFALTFSLYRRQWQIQISLTRIACARLSHWRHDASNKKSHTLLLVVCSSFLFGWLSLFDVGADSTDS